MSGRRTLYIPSVRLTCLSSTNLNPGADDHPEAVDAEEAASKLWKVFMSHGIEDTGRFWHREGFELPW